MITFSDGDFVTQIERVPSSTAQTWRREYQFTLLYKNDVLATAQHTIYLTAWHNMLYHMLTIATQMVNEVVGESGMKVDWPKFI